MLMDDLKRLMELTEKKSGRQLALYQKEIIQQYKSALTAMKLQLSSYYENNYTTARLSSVIDKIENILKDAGVKGIKTTKSGIKETVVYNYNAVQTNLQKTIGIEVKSVLNDNMINSLVVNNKFSKINWQSKGISNINNANKILRTEITQGIIQGKNYGEVVKNITHQMSISASDALRIVKTESHRASNEARILSMNESKDAAEKLGFKSVKIWEGGSSFSRGHDSMNGTAIGIDEMFQLPSGAETEAPGMSGNAEDDVNCGCFITFSITEI